MVFIILFLPRLFPYPAVPSTPKIASQLTLQNGIDIHVGAVISFEGLEGVQAIMTSSMRQVPPHPVIIQGSKGEIRLTGKACCPDGFIVQLHGEKEQTFHFGQPEKGNGLVRLSPFRPAGQPYSSPRQSTDRRHALAVLRGR